MAAGTPLTLGQQLQEVNAAISAVLKRKEYTTSDGITFKSEDLSQLRGLKREILENINSFGANYVEGQETTPSGDTSYVSFE
jgi:hypothetical protein